MDIKSVRTKMFGAVFGLIFGLTANATAAQSIPQPPILSLVDDNGVNLATGALNLPGIEVEIGVDGSGLGREAQTYIDANGVVQDPDNLAGTITTSSIQSFAPGGVAPSTAYFLSASYAGVVHRFRVGTDMGSGVSYSSGPYREINHVNGASLSCTSTGASMPSGTCTMVTLEGAAVVYTNGFMQTATKRDGEVITVTYFGSNQALNTISSTLGWTLKYTVDGSYKVTGVTAVNTSITPCTTTVCAPGSSFPSVTMSTSGATRTLTRNGINLGSYAINGSIVTITTPAGVTKTVTLSGNKVASVAVGGSTWTYAYGYDSSNYALTTVTAPNGTTRKVAMQYADSVVYQVDEANRKTSYIYDSNERVVKRVDPDGSAQTGGYIGYTYDYLGRVTQVDVVPKGGATNGVVNAGAATVTKASYFICDGNNTSYCNDNKPQTTTDSNGVVTTYAYYTNNGNLASVTTPAVNSVSAQTRFTYAQLTPRLKDAGGNLVNQPVVWRLTAMSTCMSSNWNGAACSGGATDERKTTVSYNTTNLLAISKTVSRGDGSLPQTTVDAYNDNGWILASDGPKPGAVDETYAFYDVLGRRIGLVGVDPDGTGARRRPAGRSHYNADGKVDETDSGVVGPGTSNNVYSGADGVARNAQAFSDWTTMVNNAVYQQRDTNEFDGYGRPISAKHFIGSSTTPKDVTQRSYDNMQRLDCQTVRLNSANYGSAACTIGAALGDGSRDRIVKYAYDTLGNVTSTTSAYGTSVARIDALKVFDIASATSTAMLSYIEDAKGNRTSYFYDAFNRLIKICYPTLTAVHSSSSSDCVQTTYRTTTLTGGTQAGSLANIQTLRGGGLSDPNAAVTFGYDALGRMASKSGAMSESLTYNNFDQVLTHTNNTTGGASASETYAYNSLGWMLSDAQGLGTVSYGYDAYGKRNQMTYPGSGLYVTYGYNDGDELTGIFENGSAQIASFAYDDYGRRTSTGRGSGYATGIGYDSNLRLQTLALTALGSAGDTVTLGYNPVDQISSRTHSNNSYYAPVPSANITYYGVNGLNQITPINNTVPTYDGHGNMTSDGAISFVYNANNLMTSTSSGASLVYDAENRLVSYTASSTTTKFLYDGADLIAEYDGSGNLLRRYVHGPGDDEPLVWYEGAGTGTKRYFLADERGSIVGVTDATGNMLAINSYNEYGVPTTSNATYAGRFRYTGQVWLGEISLYYYKARMYAPTLGRFMQTDPIGYGDGMNWYAYVGNDPINSSDPTGLDGTADEPPPQEVIVVRKRPDGSDGDNEDRTLLGNILHFADVGASYVVPGYGLLKCVGGLAFSSLHCNGKQWSKAAVGAAVDAALIVAGGPALKLVGTVAEKTVGKLAFEAGAKLLESACFTAGTQIATPTGLVAIQDIKVGDLVLSYDVERGQTVSKPVTELIRLAPQTTYEVRLKNGQGEVESIRATAEHPWLMTSHQWEGTQELDAGELIETAQGEKLSVISVKSTGDVEPVYNFTVADTHTYLVGKNHAVVHNSCGILNQVMKHFAEQGWTAGKFKNVLGWGTKAEGAVGRLGQIDAAAVAAMREQGLTKGMVRGLRSGYADAVTRGVGEGVAEVRVQLLDAILKNW